MHNPFKLRYGTFKGPHGATAATFMLVLFRCLATGFAES